MRPIGITESREDYASKIGLPAKAKGPPFLTPDLLKTFRVDSPAAFAARVQREPGVTRKIDEQYGVESRMETPATFFEPARSIHAAMKRNTEAMRLLNGANFGRILRGTQILGVPFQCRLDAVQLGDHDRVILLGVKNAMPYHKFGNSIEAYQYVEEIGLQQCILARTLGLNPDAIEVALIGAETQTHTTRKKCVVHWVDPVRLHDAMVTNLETIDNIIECRRKKNWPKKMPKT